MILATVFPGWLNLIIAASALLTAIGVLWRLVVKPGAELVTLGNQLKPLLVEMVGSFSGEKGSFKILAEISEQFRNNGGSTLRDVIDGLASTARANSDLMAVIQASLEASKALASADREHLASLTLESEQMKAWRKEQQRQAIADAQTAERLELRMAAQEEYRSRAEVAAAKVLADNDPDTDLPTVRPTPKHPSHRDVEQDTAAAKVLADNDPDTDLPTVHPTQLASARDVEQDRAAAKVRNDNDPTADLPRTVTEE